MVIDDDYDDEDDDEDRDRANKLFIYRLSKQWETKIIKDMGNIEARLFFVVVVVVLYHHHKTLRLNNNWPGRKVMPAC